MKHPERSEDYLEHILEMIEDATTFIKDVENPKALEKDRKTQAAVVRCITIIGEAANQLQQRDPKLVESHLGLPWRDMRDMRNKIVHGYFDVNNQMVWDTVKNDLPELDKQVRSLMNDLRLAPEKPADARPSFQEFRDQAERDKGKDTSRDR